MYQDSLNQADGKLQPLHDLEIKATSSYERVKKLQHNLGGQATKIEVVRKLAPNILSRVFRTNLSEEQLVRKSYSCHSESGRFASSRKYLLSEYEILSKLQHPNIIRYVDFEYKPRKDRWNASIYTEYCPGGDLTQYTTRNEVRGDTITEEQFWSIFHQLASALLYCHCGLKIDGKDVAEGAWQKPILHRDIKPANIVVSSKQLGQIKVKILDFGFAKHQASFLGSQVGTPGFMSPVRYIFLQVVIGLIPGRRSMKAGREIGLQNQTSSPSENGAAVDVKLSDGVTLLHLAAGGGHGATVNLLLGMDLDPNCTDNAGRTPLLCAVENREEEAARILLRGGADPNHPKNGKLNPVSKAVEKNAYAILELLLSNNADLNGFEDGGKQFLLSTIRYGHFSLLGSLLRRGLAFDFADFLDFFKGTGQQRSIRHFLGIMRQHNDMSWIPGYRTQCVQLQSKDEAIITVDRSVAECSRLIRYMLTDWEIDTPSDPIPLFEVEQRVLEKVLEWCYFHCWDDIEALKQWKISLEVEEWDYKYAQMEQGLLFEVLLAANYLEITALMDCLSKAVANMLRGKSPAEMRKLLNIQNDFSPEEEEQIRRESEWAQDR
ncbi:s-phase kinase-associated protein 1 [Stemphylium lycopersici]|nr:s-phase kinase-associated protein 1 [Stemphylium lycopersici]